MKEQAVRKMKSNEKILFLQGSKIYLKTIVNKRV